MVNTPLVIVDRSLEVRKELEHEVLRDASDNALANCNMENLDPMRFHVGESMVNASSQKLTDSEYYRPRALQTRSSGA